MSTVIMAGIVAKGIGVLLAIVGFGFVLGVIATLMVTSRIRRPAVRVSSAPRSPG